MEPEVSFDKYEGRLKSSWTGGIGPLLYKGRRF
jgi:hypothetical protein